ncbi:MAG: alpha/beta fold hydrolase [Acidimicrobiales bacterium]
MSTPRSEPGAGNDGTDKTTAEYLTRRVAGKDGVELTIDVWLPEQRLQGPERPGFVLVHGLASNARLYDGVARALVGAGHGAATVDLRGHGRSAKPDSGYDYDTMCADLAAVLEALVIDPGRDFFERPVVVGQSFGGNLVLELAARYPDKLSGVACIDGGTIDLGERFATWDEVSSALAPPKIEGARWEEVRGRFSEMHPDWPEAGIRGALANFEVRDDGTVAPFLTFDRHLAILRAMWERRTKDLFSNVHVPVLLLPAESPDAPAAWTADKHSSTQSALSELERAEVHWFSPADHDVHAQHPDEVAAVLLAASRGLFASS